uniref:Peptidase A1 domain-containing protein n=1 Tax=Kalanchoe fedtschenkoi TaxID=63787 RepID=A0A7N0UWZ2_KALFE
MHNFKIDGKFSYCLAVFGGAGDGTSPINFGFVVGNEFVQFTGSSAPIDEGNIIIDSGTTLVLLPTDFYSLFQTVVSEQIRAKPVLDPLGFFGLCYNNNDFAPPTIKAKWAGGDVELKDYNTFVRVTKEVVCLAFAPSNDLAIYGNLAQTNFLVGYDNYTEV